MQTVKIDQLIPDAKNANKGTDRGRKALLDSLKRYGGGRSVLLDKDGRIIAGNKTVEAAAGLGIEDVIVVQTDGKQIVAVQRTDLDIDSPEGRGLAIADNRVGELDLSWDVEQLMENIRDGVDLEGLFFDFELDKILGREGEEFDPNAEWQGMPEFEQSGEGEPATIIEVKFYTLDDVKLFASALGQDVRITTKSIWYPDRLGKPKLYATQTA